ncbi:MAG: hypothetical protein ACI85U_002152 [Candidatus Promineifilaceae bacterium]|jgi:hypothetical protein
MNLENKMTTAERIEKLMHHLGIDKAHFAGRSGNDWSGSALEYPKRIASLSLVGLGGFEVPALEILAPRLQIICGDKGASAAGVQIAKNAVPTISHVTIPDYDMIGWDDVMADHTDEIGQALINFLAKHQLSEVEPLGKLDTLEGDIAEISYQIRGSGPPLILLPLGLAPSQWEPLIPTLAEHYCTITLGGMHLGIIPDLEIRGSPAGYQRITQNLMGEAQLQSGQTILDVGFGSGVTDR